MRQLAMIEDLESIAASIDQHLDRIAATGSSDDSRKTAAVLAAPIAASPLAALRAEVEKLKGYIKILKRPLLDETEREIVIHKIMSGLFSFPAAEAARHAAKQYNEEWFDNETDPELRKQLATRLLHAYGTHGFGNPDLWRKYAA